VKPVLRNDGEGAFVDSDAASPWSNEVSLTPNAGKGFSCYFNRGLIMSQFMSHYLQRRKIDPKRIDEFKNVINDNTERVIRGFLGGDLMKKLYEVLDTAIDRNQHVYLALFELSDESLIRRLLRIGSHAHIVLANGSYSGKTPDRNSDAREQLEKAKVDVRNRILKVGLGHNKFLVVCSPKNRPQAVWTSSANWTATALCTQINNSVFIEDGDVARTFLSQWHQLSEAGSEHPESLVKSNSVAKKASCVGVVTWFTPTSREQELEAVGKMVADAKQGILFLMFQPGSSPLLKTINGAAVDGLYVHGVISTMSGASASKTRLSLIHHTSRMDFDLGIVNPEGIDHQFSNWAAEVTRNEFLRGIGWAIVHSKVILIDPLGDNPVVVTGSHNFSKSASSKNDENMVVITGNKELALAYAVNVKSVYDHFRWRAFVHAAERKNVDPSKFMKYPKRWQYRWLKGTDGRAELAFWLGG
jgi:phosphatidylserine/phosphatidylglycerophosphate/cardiolipin synthase-like enzyme